MFEQCVASPIGATGFCSKILVQLPNVSRVDPSGIGTGKVTKEKDQEN